MSKIATALDNFRALYSEKVSAGSLVADVTKAFSSSNSRIIKDSLGQGMKVYALPLKNGKGMLEKWRVQGGRLVRDASGKPVIKKGPKQIAAMFLCSPKSKNIGSDELLVGKEKSIEGIKRHEALNVFEMLAINPAKDAYVLFIRRPQEIQPAVKEFRSRLEGIFKKGGQWRPGYRFSGKLDARFMQRMAGQLVGQAHPHLRKSILADFFGPDFMKDPFLSSQVKKALKSTPKKAKRRKATK